MATVYDFTPAQNGPFQFQPTLDGQTYNCVVTCNLFGRRYYLSCYALDGTRIFTVPVISSTDGHPLSMTAGYFASRLTFQSRSQQFTVDP